MYFIIRELLGISRNTLLSVAKDAYLNYYYKTTHYAQNYLLNFL